MKKLFEIFIVLFLGATMNAQVLTSLVPNVAATSVMEWQRMEGNNINPDSSYIQFWKGFADFSGLTLVYDVLNSNIVPEDIIDFVYSVSGDPSKVISSIVSIYNTFKYSDKAYTAGMIVAIAVSHRAVRWDAIHSNTVRLSYIELELDNAYLKVNLPRKFYKDVMEKHGNTKYAIENRKSTFIIDGEDYISMVLLGSDWKKLTFNTKHGRFQTQGFNEFTNRNYRLVLENVRKSKRTVNGKPIYTANAFNMFPLLPKE